MLEKPTALQEHEIIASLQAEYGLVIDSLQFLPLGNDAQTVVFRAVIPDSRSCFVKLRSGSFNAVSILVPHLLHAQGSPFVIAPVATRAGKLWTTRGEYHLAVFPFISGQDGSEAGLSDRHWLELGRALKQLHAVMLPQPVLDRIPRETYSDHWRQQVRHFQQQAMQPVFADPIATELAAFLRHKQVVIQKLVGRAAHLAALLSRPDRPMVVCHADIHIWNTFIDSDGHLYIVDWDTLIRAPRERDLMFIGGGLFGNQRSPAEEMRLFYEGYGDTPVDPVALAYYRYERIVQDIAAYAEQILLTQGSDRDRANGLNQLKSQFAADGLIEFVFQSDSNPASLYPLE